MRIRILMDRTLPLLASKETTGRYARAIESSLAVNDAVLLPGSTECKGTRPQYLCSCQCGNRRLYSRDSPAT